jgi:hypothetical protein
LFYALNLTGEKMGKGLIVPVWLGMWMSSALLLVIAIFITRKALADRNLWEPRRKRIKSNKPSISVNS